MTNAPKRQPIPFGKYLLLDRINIGGMAEVWRGKTFGAGGFERLVAIKRILPSIAEDEEFITMFIDEAKISVQLTHANIGQVHDLGNITNSYFIAMEYIPGKDLRAIFERCRKKGEPAPIPLTCYVIAKLCEGLDYAHRKKDGMGRDMNIVHRDVSPQNVLVSYEGEVKVIDFGIAKAANKATKTQAGILKGKFGYMSPEQIRGLPLDRRSDVFAIGICLYEMLTGERLFVGDSDFAVLEKVRKAEILPPSTYNRRIPEDLERIVLKALARDTENRYQYANELADDLQRFLITSESIFSRKDLMAYMKATFAEEVEREKIRLQEYVEVKAPEGVAAAAELGYSSGPNRPPSLAGNPPGPSGGNRPPTLTSMPAAPSNPRMLPGPQELTPGPTVPMVKRSPSLTNLPKLTAAAPQTARDLDDGGGATQVSDGPDAAPTTGPQAFVDAPEPRTTPGEVPAARPAPSAPVRNSGSHPAVKEPARRPSGSHPAPRKEPTPKAMVLGESRPKTRAERPVIEAEEQIRSEPSPVPPASGIGNRIKLVAALASVLILSAIVALVVVLLPAPEGFVVVDVVDPTARSRARVNINGTLLPPPAQWPLLQKTRAGNTVVMVVADGYKPYLTTVEVKEGAHPATVTAELKPMVDQVELLVITDPDAAEVVLDDKVVKAAGMPEVYAGQLPVGTQLKLEVRHPGYQPSVQTVRAASADQPLRLKVRLERSEFPLSVVSQPEGALVMVEGKTVGTTPATVKVAGGTRKVTLLKHCFTPEEVTLQLPDQPGEPIQVRRTLKKQPNCR